MAARTVSFLPHPLRTNLPHYLGAVGLVWGDEEFQNLVVSVIWEKISKFVRHTVNILDITKEYCDCYYMY